MRDSLVIMGVAGCGKSSLGAALACKHGLVLLEGDDHHSQTNRDKMRNGTPLTDADREGWLDQLAAELQSHPQGRVLTCSALRRAYRDRLRRVAPGLRFIFLDISRHEALARVAARPSHFFSATLVDSQFATLEPPLGEPGVLRVDAAAPLPQLLADASAWLLAQEPT